MFDWSELGMFACLWLCGALWLCLTAVVAAVIVLEVLGKVSET